MNQCAIPALLARAWSDEVPGPALPPGPRSNQWGRIGAVPVEIPPPVRALLDGLWRGGGFHRLGDGSLSTVVRRPVPSAGGCYPVQTHLHVGAAGLDGLPAGNYAFDREAGILWARPAPPTRPDSLNRISFTVQPGRTYGRYRHRTWPLWVADVAYAVAAVRFLLEDEVPVELGPGDRVRTHIALPAGGDTDAWLSDGLVPEIPLASVELPAGWSVNPLRVKALSIRRSPSTTEFGTQTGPLVEGAALVAQLSGQAWVRGADEVNQWWVDLPTPCALMPGSLISNLWRAHLEAAGIVYGHCLAGSRRCRPVSGLRASGDRWLVHAVVTLDAVRGEDDR